MKYFRILILVTFFCSILTLSVGLPFFNSPDENANFIFAEQFASHQTFKIKDEINLELNGIAHPRSAIALGETVVPVSFLGLPFIAGIIGSVFGSGIMLWITPILAILAVLAWHSLILKLFKNERIADLSALFLMIHPGFWYYSARTMMHNVGFVALLIIGAWFAFVGFSSTPSSYGGIKGGRIFDWLGSGLALGLALSFRTSEIIWISAIVLVLFIVYRKFIIWKNLAAFSISLIIILSGFGGLNYSTYGFPFQTGYTIESESSVEAYSNTPAFVELDALDEIISVIPFANYLFPFGIHESNIKNNVWNYGFVLYPWMTVLAVIGLIFVARDKKWQKYIWITLGLSIWLGIVYGSWKFNDNPDASVVTLGNSYVRYWLPLFVLASGFCAVATDRISTSIKNKKIQTSVLSVLVILSIASSTMLVVWGEDGFVKTRQSLAGIEEKYSQIVDQTADDSIIIVDMADKYLWPDRRVVTPLRSEVTYLSIPKMLELTDVYYFGITLPQEDLNYLNEVKLKDLGAQIEEVIQISDETLYRITND